MRAAIINALLADPDVAAVVGTRVFPMQGREMVISEKATPEAFDADGVVRPSLVVAMANTSAMEDPLGAEHLVMEQLFQVWAVDNRDFTEIWKAAHAVRRRLDYHSRPDDWGALTPVNTPEVSAWTRTRLIEFSPEMVMPPMDLPAVVATMGAQVRIV